MIRATWTANRTLAHVSSVWPHFESLGISVPVRFHSSHGYGETRVCSKLENHITVSLWTLSMVPDSYSTVHSNLKDYWNMTCAISRIFFFYFILPVSSIYLSRTTNSMFVKVFGCWHGRVYSLKYIKVHKPVHVFSSTLFQLIYYKDGGHTHE